jgi:NAD-dependent dihydropyrimidine dehydrogenase PreA subunit
MSSQSTENLSVHPSQEKLAKVFSSITLLGPPMSDKLLRLVAHLFTREEAEIAIHLPFYYPRPIEKISRKASRPADEIKPLLESMADRKLILKTSKGYSLLPLIPGMFERMLISGVDTDWHRKYAELLNDIYATGYMRAYNTTRTPGIRSIPVQKSVETKNRVLDADLVSEMIDFHEDLAVANVCQCRQATHFIGKDCKRSSPHDGCLVFGSYATSMINSGDCRRVSKEEMKEIVIDRWEKKLVFFTANIESYKPNAICTCCDCCCHYLESVNNYNGIAGLAHPHFLARVDESLCDNCGRCVKPCNTYAHVLQNKKHIFLADKCVGCGNCVASCKQQAISLSENPVYERPSKNFLSLGTRLLPAISLGSIRARLKR